MNLKLKEDELEKNTNNDKISAIRDEIRYLFELNGMMEYASYQDHTDECIYFDMWNETKRNYTYFKVDYTYDGVVVVIISEIATPVIRQTQWTDLPVETKVVDTEKTVLSLVEKALATLVGTKPLPIIKALDNEQMIAIEPLYSVAGMTDLHGDMPTMEANASLVETFNKALDEGYMQAGLFHKHKTNSFHFNKAWLQEEDVMMGETLVKAGTPLVELQFTNEKAWELKKSGEFMPPSVGAKGNIEDLEDDD